MTNAESRRRTPGGVAGDILLWVASIGGAICIVVVILALGFHITLIMFKTGSMAPTIPTGSLAVVHEIPASQIHVGDVVTVDRPGQLPVTHRVTSVTGSGPTRTITLRGDANPTDDIAPYVVNTVRIVWWSIPGWAGVVVWFSNPVVLGGLTVGATALVTWAFWPRDSDRGRRRAPRGRAARRRKTAAATGVSVIAIALALAAGTPSQAARAADVETVTSSAYLTLTSIGDPVLMGDMTAFSPVPWQVGVQAHPPDAGVVHIGVTTIGTPTDPGEFSLEAQSCPTRWAAGVCSSTPDVWLPATDLSTIHPTDPIGAHELGSMGSSDQRWLMLTVTMTDPGAAAIAQLQLWAWGSDGALSTTSGSLAVTGTDGWFSPAMLAFLAVSAGLILAAISRRRFVETADHD